jgi:ubiquinone/menaquinone biosynthesis C-methylase UbiE
MLALNSSLLRVVAVGEALPFRDGVFDAVFSAYVFRNLDSVDATLSEMARVLRSGGRAGIVGLGRPQSNLQASVHRAGSAVALRAVGLASGAYDEYTYLHHSLDKLAPPEGLFADRPLDVVELWRMGPLGFVYGVVLEKA